MLTTIERLTRVYTIVSTVCDRIQPVLVGSLERIGLAITSVSGERKPSLVVSDGLS